MALCVLCIYFVFLFNFLIHKLPLDTFCIYCNYIFDNGAVLPCSRIMPSRGGPFFIEETSTCLILYSMFFCALELFGNHITMLPSFNLIPHCPALLSVGYFY
uniref:Secreted protein n=1 Tax=Ixodes scapularis TaxID=6945 RepID=A0A4D5RX64_IXOSC